MTFLIISHALHKKNKGSLYAYAPYVQEMNLWIKHVGNVEIVAPLVKDKNVSLIDIPYEHESINTRIIPQIQFTTVITSIVSLFKIPYILFVIFRASSKADHIHLRCPGNIGLLGCFVQIFFPKKLKTAKYAGNWDPNAKQPLSYRLQKRILKNEFLTRKMKVLVYGDWKDSSKNILPFFTASYNETEKITIKTKSLGERINLLFVGTLSSGKQPLLSIQAIQKMVANGLNVYLDVYGEGEELQNIREYLSQKELKDRVTLQGNQDKETIKIAYQKAHFLVFISKSEGWPKVVAEAMFWKCLPISSSVSCIPYMLDYGNRGSLIDADPDKIAQEIFAYIHNEEDYQKKIIKAYNWSREYTLNKFEEEIKTLLK